MIDDFASRLITVGFFLGSAYLSFKLLIEQTQFSDPMIIIGSLVIGTFTAALWREVSLRFLVKEATAPLDRLLSR